MKEVIVTTQAEFDALPASFEQFTRIVIRDTKGYRIGVVARENSSVEAWGNSVARVLSKTAEVVLFGFAVAFISSTLSTTNKIEKKSKNCHIQVVSDLGWFKNNAVDETAFIILYKKISVDWKTQERTGNETVWVVGSTVTHPAWSPKTEECGAGKFHACSRPYFCDEFRSEPGDRYIAIRVALADTYEWPNPEYIHKIAFREGAVLYECDRLGKEIKSSAVSIQHEA